MINLQQQWVNACLAACHTRATFYSGARKIIRPYRITFTSLDDSLQLRDSGFTTNKLHMLTKNYLHEESRLVAVKLWKKRRSQEKYGSVAFSTFKVLMKGDVKGSTPRGSVFGPCLQSVVITWIDKKHYSIDVPYRTTELFKKFSPDLVFLRDVLLEPFDFKGMSLTSATFHFANLTAHPMYFTTLVPFLPDPVAELNKIKRIDPFFHKWLVKWTARYICHEYAHGISKFAQALRVKKDALERIDKRKLKTMQAYLRKNHPGYTHTRGEYDDVDT